MQKSFFLILVTVVFQFVGKSQIVSGKDSSSKLEKEYIEEIKTRVSTDDYDSIFLYCDKILKNNQTSVDSYFYGGYAKDALGIFEGAIEDYNKAIQINPRYAKVYCFRGITRAKQSSHKEAIIDFNRAILLNPQDDYAYDRRGNSKAELKNYLEAITDQT